MNLSDLLKFTPSQKATYTEVNIGTNDDKYVTPKALKDSNNVPSVAPGTSKELNIGGDRWQNRYFPGLIDEVGIWNRALTSDEITQLYNNGKGLTYNL